MNQGLSYPLAGSSLETTIPKRKLSLASPLPLHRTAVGGRYDGFTLVRNTFPDFT